MTSIVKATKDDSELLTNIGKQTFIESHGHSAAEADINIYISKTYTPDVFRDELCNPANIYHIIYYNQQPAGFSKIIFNSPHSNIKEENVTKLERIYLLKEFYSLKLGTELMKFNIELSKQNHQAGIWLFVWKENPRAVNYYTKAGFKIVGSYDFKLTESHSNPNHQMFLKY
jgi:ribosomal protein S18 acetylase RimI-like enzyme